MKKIMYEINHHINDDVFSHCSITPITITRCGVLPGCTGITIDAIDSDGRSFQGNPENYFDNEVAAMNHAVKNVQDALAAKKAAMIKIAAEISGMEKWLSSQS